MGADGSWIMDGWVKLDFGRTLRPWGGSWGGLGGSREGLGGGPERVRGRSGAKGETHQKHIFPHQTNFLSHQKFRSAEKGT